MNPRENLDYEAQLRERQMQEQRAAAQLCIKVRGVARLPFSFHAGCLSVAYDIPPLFPVDSRP